MDTSRDNRESTLTEEQQKRKEWRLRAAWGIAGCLISEGHLEVPKLKSNDFESVDGFNALIGTLNDALDSLGIV